MISTIIIPIIFIIMIVLWLWGKIDQTLVSLCGAIGSIFSLLIIDGNDFSAVIDILFGTPSNGFVNFHSLLLSLGMLFIISVCQETGVFSFIAFKIVQKTRGQRYQLFFIICSLAFLISAILNSILTVLFFIPLTITICKILKINPIPYIIAESIIVNLGSLLFIISSMPNILIGESIGWTFVQFFTEIGLFSFILLGISFIFLSGYYKKSLEIPDETLLKVLKQYDAWSFVKNKKVFYKSIFVLTGTIILFIVLPYFTTITIDYIAISSGVLLILITSNKNLKSIMKKIDFELLFYFIGVFIVVDALEYSGALLFVSNLVISATYGNLILSSILILWLSAGMSSIMNNVPVTKLLIPIIQELGTTFSIDVSCVYTSLIYGSNLGDNLTPWGDNLIVMKISDNYHKKIHFYKYFKIGIFTAFIQLISTTTYILIRIDLQFLILGISTILLILLITILWLYYDELKSLIKNFIQFIRKIY
ncbi:MAG: SLC13 family permease [Candidatus Helarchaeota archaeon]